MSTHYRLCIIGAGPAGYTAAIYAARANLETALVMGYQAGGQLMTTTAIENWPGGEENLQGPALMDQMRAHVARYGVPLLEDHIQSCQLNSKPFELKGEKETYTADAIIIATGASPKYLGLESEKKFMGRGVSSCATCDGFFYKNHAVAVVGGGNTAVEEAIYLSQIASHVTVVHRRDQLRADPILSERLMKRPNVSMAWDCVVEEIAGDEAGVNTLRLKHLKTQEIKSLSVQGVFIAIGHIPNTALFEGQLEFQEGGYLKTGYPGGCTQTSRPGVFAAGDVADPHYRQAITSAAFGCMAALDAERYLQ